MNVPEPTPFFPTDRVAILAHRGLAVAAPENSIAAFRAALEAGVDVIESDVRATRDDVAVFAHDETFERVFGNPALVSDLTFAEVSSLAADAGWPVDHGVVSVAHALRVLPHARFNIDVKEPRVVAPLAHAIAESDATTRVLVTSFSGARRRRAVTKIEEATGVRVLSSGSADIVAATVIACFFGAPWLARRLRRGVSILQIPVRVLGIRTDSRRMVRRFHRAGFTVQFWTINEEADARRIVAAGADGLVSDRSDVLVRLFRTS